MPFADPEAGGIARGACRLHALQQISSSLLDVFHSSWIGEGTQIQLDKHLATTRLRDATIKARFQSDPIGNVLVDARIALSIRAQYQMMLRKALSLGKLNNRLPIAGMDMPTSGSALSDTYNLNSASSSTQSNSSTFQGNMPVKGSGPKLPSLASTCEAPRKLHPFPSLASCGLQLRTGAPCLPCEGAQEISIEALDKINDATQSRLENGGNHLLFAVLGRSAIFLPT